MITKVIRWYGDMDCVSKVLKTTCHDYYVSLCVSFTETCFSNLVIQITWMCIPVQQVLWVYLPFILWTAPWILLMSGSSTWESGRYIALPRELGKGYWLQLWCDKNLGGTWGIESSRSFLSSMHTYEYERQDSWWYKTPKYMPGSCSCKTILMF